MDNSLSAVLENSSHEDHLFNVLLYTYNYKLRVNLSLSI